MRELADIMGIYRDRPYGMTGRESFLTGEDEDDFYDPELERMMEQGALVMQFWNNAEQRGRTWQMKRLYRRCRGR